MAHHEVIVGNIGKVYDGRGRKEAEGIFDEYCIQSRRKTGRASGEDVTWMVDDDIHRENSIPHLRVVKNPPVYWAESGWVATKAAAKKVSHKAKVPKGCRYIPVGTSGKFVIECTDKDAVESVVKNGSENKIAMVGVKKNGSGVITFEKAAVANPLITDFYMAYQKDSSIGSCGKKAGKYFSEFYYNDYMSGAKKSKKSTPLATLAAAKKFIVVSSTQHGGIVGNPFGFGKTKQTAPTVIYAKPAKSGQSVKVPDEYGISDLMVDSRARSGEANYNVHIFYPKSTEARESLLNDNRWIVVDGPVRLAANPRNVTNEIVKAFRAKKSKTIDNTRTDGNSIWLFTSKIVERRETGVFITTAGNNTRTTKDRLSPFAEVKVKAGELYCNGEPWSGGWKKVGAI